jgi:hypothetical protein
MTYTRHLLHSAFAALLISGLASAPLGAEPSAVLPEGALLVEDRELAKQLGTRAAQALAAEATRAAERGDAAALMRMARQSDRGTALLREAALARALDALMRRSPDRRLDALLEALQQHDPRVFQRHPETAGDWFVPVFALDQLALGVARQWALERDAAGLIAAWRNSDPAQFAKRVSAADQRARYRAAEQLELTELRRYEAALEKSSASSPGVAALLARRGGAVDDFIRAYAIERGEHRTALVADAQHFLAGTELVEFARRAAHESETASAAVLSLGEAARHPGAARSQLLDWLVDPVLGTSAAAALAELPVPELLALFAPLHARADPTLLLNLALALRLNGDASAMTESRRLEAESARLRSARQ